MQKLPSVLLNYNYLGHIIHNSELKGIKENIVVMLKWPRPSNVTKLHRFLGLIGYYSKYFRNYDIIG